MPTHLPAAFALFVAACPLLSAAPASSVTFEKDVRPILKEHCFHCHGEAGVKEAELDLRLRRWIVAGGDSGASISPGKPDDSLLIDRVVSGDMPPGDKHLSSEDIAVLREWILAGARTARDEPESIGEEDYFTDEERNYWAFQPIQPSPPPSLRDPQIQTPIDSFILDRLQEKGLTFSERADRITLIRRVTFDLWGLPPTSEMVDRFVNDEHPFAYERLIERLLSSPLYGERWARHWLDVAGYADSEGYTDRDITREFAYFYRDYVIDSFNENKPLDVFIREQLAGDEMSEGAAELTAGRISRLAATGFLRMAPDGTADGSVDRSLAANDNIAATLEVVSTTMLGMTVGCARCHDHRYDPISQADYYRFRAIFAPALDWKNWKRPNQRRVSLYTASDREARDAIECEAKAAESKRAMRQKEHINRTLDEELLVVPDKVRDSLRTAFNESSKSRTPEQIALLEEYPSVGNINNGSLYLYAEQRARRAKDIERAAEERQARYLQQLREQQLRKVPDAAREILREMLEIPVGERNDKQKELAKNYPEVFVKAEDLESLWPEKHEEIERYRDAARRCREQDAKTELAEMQKQVVAIRARAPKERFLRVLSEPANHQPPTHLFIRGDHNQPGQTVSPADLAILRQQKTNPIAENNARISTSGRRLAYANQLTSGAHPLLPRVLVNRIWLNHFGRAIVATPGDFGRLGARPSHPKLLDWLASELIENQWDMKHLHRLILQSHTYQQSSKRTQQLDQLDPDNRLFARMSTRRLESEAVRDSILAVSNSMVRRMHGPPVPVKEDGVGQIVIGNEMLDGERKPTGKQESFEGLARRSIYVQVRRTRPLAVLESFDIATSSPNCTIRSSSNVATQALMMMNSDFTIHHAEKMASDLINESDDLRHQLTNAWRRCFSAPPETEDLAELEDFVDRQTAALRARNQSLKPIEARRQALASACQAMLSSNGFLYID